MAAPMSCLVSYSDSNSSEESSDDEVSKGDDAHHVNRKRPSGDLIENETTDSHAKCAKKEEVMKDRLPMPDGIVNMFGTKEDHSDDPTEHGGRQRTFQHEKGNWASFVHVAMNPDTGSRLRHLAQALITCLRPYAQFTVQEDLHLSLSRTFVIRHHWIDSLVTSLRSNLANHHGCTCVLSSSKIYCNDEKTRTFLAIKVDKSVEVLKSFVEAIDQSLQEFRLPVYYEDPSFHVSLAWAVGDVTEKITPDVIQDLQETIDDFFLEDTSERILNINQLRLKTGNKIFYVPLLNK